MVELLGIIAAFFTTASFLPQVIKAVKSKNTAGISLLMYSCFSFGVFLWLIYGFAVESFAVILANSITLPLALIILYFKIRNKD